MSFSNCADFLYWGILLICWLMCIVQNPINSKSNLNKFHFDDMDWYCLSLILRLPCLTIPRSNTTLGSAFKELCAHTVCACFPLSNVLQLWGRLWNKAAIKITFQCPISCLSERMKWHYKHHCASWLSDLRSFVRDWASKSILAFLCQQLCSYMMMSLLPLSSPERNCIFTVRIRTFNLLHESMGRFSRLHLEQKPMYY